MRIHRIRASRAYTLLEMLVAMTIFAIISVSAGFALVHAGRAQMSASTYANDMREARAILGRIADDIRWAYASADSPMTQFVATGTPRIRCFPSLRSRTGSRARRPGRYRPAAVPE